MREARLDMKREREEEGRKRERRERGREERYILVIILSPFFS